MVNIKAIIFDLDGVYFKDGTKNFLDNISKIYKLDRDLIVQKYLKSEEMRLYKQDKISSDDYWNWFISELNISSSISDILIILRDSYSVNKEAINLLKMTKELNIFSVICSNNFRERIELLDSKFKFRNDFDYVILSYEFNKLKPNLLDEVKNKTNLNPDEILLIDDSDYNINYANKIGYNTIFCKKVSELKTKLKEFDILL